MSSSADGLTIRVRTKGHSAVCPCCGHESRSVHSYRPRKLQALEFMDRSVTIIVDSRHFRCENSECKRKIFAEPLKMSAPYRRMTNDVYERIRYEALNQAAPSAVQTLSQSHIRTSVSTCHRLVRDVGSSNPIVRSSGYAGIDDFAKKKGHVYACAIVDHYTRDTLAVFDTRYGKEITEWFAAHPEIKLVTRDGSQSYAEIIRAASADIVQVSDRFHLIKNLKETSVDLIKSLLGKSQKMQYPYPDEQEAYSLIFNDILSMGEERHRVRVREYYQIRELKDQGKSIGQISQLLSITPQKVYRRQHEDISKVLSSDQKMALSVARKMARIIATKKITPEAVFSRLDGKVSSRLVHRCMRSVVDKYKRLRKNVKDYNENHKGVVVSVKKTAIWNYIRTGKTTSERLLLLNKTHPHVQQIIDICIRFCNMIHARDGAPDVTTWIKESESCPYSQISSFVAYIRKDVKAIEQACITNYSNAIMEGNVNRAKAIKRSMYNRAGIRTLRAKMVYQRRPNALRFCT